MEKDKSSEIADIRESDTEINELMYLIKISYLNLFSNITVVDYYFIYSYN